MKPLSTAAVFCTLSLAVPALVQAQGTLSYTDNAANYSGDYNGLNGGTGFQLFQVQTSGGNYHGTFIGSSAASENGTAIIDTSGKSFGLYANTASDSKVTIIRPFQTTMQSVGDTFKLDLVTGYSDGGSIGVSLNSAGLFQYTAGGTGFTFNNQPTGLGYNNGALHLTWQVTGSDTYSFNASGAVNYSGTGTYTAGQLNNLTIFQQNAGAGDSSHNAYFNNLDLEVTPAPTGLVSLLIGLGVVGTVALVRRRRTTN